MKTYSPHYQYLLENPDDVQPLHPKGMHLMPWQDGGSSIESPKQKRDYGSWLYPVLPADHAEREREYQEGLKKNNLNY